MPPAHLGIDFGTSHTVAVLRRANGRVEALVFDDGSPLLRSAVYAGRDGNISVGIDAVHSARIDPACFEPNPKRRVDDGSALLGEREIAVVDLFAAVLTRVRERCVEVERGVPANVTLTHPAVWGPTRKRVLRAAAGKVGFPSVRLLPEPVAAAAYYARELQREVPVGASVVVHDFGGGTFDASVVRRTANGFDVLAVDGLDDLGGVDIDEAIAQHLRTQFGVAEAWERLLTPESGADRRHLRMFREDVRQTKERLSRQSVAELYIPVLDMDVHVTREELERITTPLLARAVNVTQAVVEEADLPQGHIAGVFLVGGGSRMPLVATLLHRGLSRAPTIIDNIEQVVAHGAILDGQSTPPTVHSAPAPVSAPPVPVRPPHQPIQPPYGPVQSPPMPYAAGQPAPMPVVPGAPPSLRAPTQGQLSQPYRLVGDKVGTPRPARPPQRPSTPSDAPGDKRAIVVLLFGILLTFETIGEIFPGYSVSTELWYFMIPNLAFLILSSIVYWGRLLKARWILISLQMLYLSVHVAAGCYSAIAGDSADYRGEQIPFVIAGIVAVELLSSPRADAWFKPPNGPPTSISRAPLRFALFGILAVVVAVSTAMAEPPDNTGSFGAGSGGHGVVISMPLVLGDDQLATAPI